MEVFYLRLFSAILLAILDGTFCNTQIGEEAPFPYGPHAQTIGHPWPWPHKYMSSTATNNINPSDFKFKVTGQTCDILETAFKRYLGILFGDQPRNIQLKSAVNVLNVMVIRPCDKGNIYPSLDSNESYTLKISNGSAVLSAQEIWGALRGLETFSQIVYLDTSNQYLINNTFIDDFPRFAHRGFLADTSRHFVPVSVLKTNLDALAQNKFNVFHWHIVDDPSFPYVSKTFPNLSKKGSFPPENVHEYTHKDVEDIIEYGRLLGIRIIPEFDTPGHTQSWGPGQPDLLTPCYKGNKPDGSYGPINPVPNSTYQFITKFFGEVNSVFPDGFTHLGGDEVSFNCWKSNPNVTAFMKQMGFNNDYKLLEKYYIEKLVDIIVSQSKQFLVWQEVIDNNAKVKGDPVVHVWKAGYKDELSKVTKLGYRTLLSSCWYLNYISYGPDWPKHYACDPQDFVGNEKQKDLIMGGEACMWGEYVDATNLISRSWPRAAAVGERLWSPASINNVNLAAPRLEEHRCRMVKRGFQAEPPNGPSYCRTEY